MTGKPSSQGLIGAIQGVETAHIQRLLTEFAERRSSEGLRVVGVIEIATPKTKLATGLSLKNLTTGEVFSITQSLGSGSSACQLDTQGLAAASSSVERDFEQGADILILSKFGKVEAGGGGLLSCFAAAAGAGVSCLTGVAPDLTAAFLAFTGEFGYPLKPFGPALEQWWAMRSQSGGR